MSSRIAFYAHVLLVVIGMVMGMSETYRWLAWAQVLGFVSLPMMLGNLAMPLVILALAKREQRSPGTIAAATILSAILTVTWFFAIFPLFM